MNKLIERFGQGKAPDWNQRLFFPVIHVAPGDEFETGYRGTHVALESGADGVFIIAHSRATSSDKLSEVVRDIRAILERDGIDFPVGINHLTLTYDPIRQIQEATRLGEIPMVWSDNPEGQREVESSRKQFGWKGLYFGAVAFKYQDPVSNKALPLVANNAIWMDVETTSGEGTGEAIDLEKARVFAGAVPNVARAVASGVSIENIAQIIPYFHAFLVASSIAEDWHHLDPVKTAELATFIHNWRPE